MLIVAQLRKRAQTLANGILIHLMMPMLHRYDGKSPTADGSYLAREGCHPVH